MNTPCVDKFWLFTLVGKAALITTIGCVSLLLLGIKIAVTQGEQEILGVTMAFLPAGIAAYWIFQKLQTHYTRREARAVATAFGVFTPCMHSSLVFPKAQRGP